MKKPNITLIHYMNDISIYIEQQHPGWIKHLGQSYISCTFFGPDFFQ